MNGWLCIDKHSGYSSNFILTKVRKIFGEKCGYVGTLDPFATGVLPVAIGEARKFIQFLDESKKTYICTIRLGTSTDTLDIDGNITGQTDLIPDEKSLMEVSQTMIGDIMQTPPQYSAIKINGRRACDIMRRGQSVQLSPRKVHIYSIKLINYSKPTCQATLEISCSAGTYIRSLIDTIARKAGSLAFAESLRRTQSGFFSIETAHSLAALSSMNSTSLEAILIPCANPLTHIAEHLFDNASIKKLMQGQRVTVDPALPDGLTKVTDTDNRFWGIAQISHEQAKAVRLLSCENQHY